MKSPLEVNVDKFFIDFQWPYDAQIIPRRFQVARRALLLDPNLLTPPGRAQRASERNERSDHDLYRALRFLSIFSCVSIASVSCTFLDIFRVLLFVILVRASRSDAKTGFLEGVLVYKIIGFSLGKPYFLRP